MTPAEDPGLYGWKKHARLFDAAERHKCGRGAILRASAETGILTIIPIRCKLWNCPKCGPWLTRTWAKKLATGRPERFLTLTCDTKQFDDPEEAANHIKKVWPKFVQMLRKKIGHFDYALVWELTEAGWPHLHILQRGHYMPHQVIQAIWKKLGVGYIVKVEKVYTEDGAARYLGKYLTKSATHFGRFRKRFRIIQCSRGWLPKEPQLDLPHPDESCATKCTFAHAAQAAEFAIRHLGYKLLSDPDTGRLFLWHPQCAGNPDLVAKHLALIERGSVNEAMPQSLLSMGVGLTPTPAAPTGTEWPSADVLAAL